jgi:molecular chaperone GrpE
MTHEKHDEHKHKKEEEASLTNSTSSNEEMMKGVGEETNSGEKPVETGEENVTIPLKEYAAQMKEIDELKNQIKDYSDGWQRERADFSNYRNRILRDQEITRQDISARVIRSFLAVSDDIELALKNAPENDDEVSSWLKGIRLIDQKLQKILESEGVQRIPAENEFFDHNRHEAICTEENPLFESGKIIEIIQQGYTIGDRVIRPARVKVAK